MITEKSCRIKQLVLTLFLLGIIFFVSSNQVLAQTCEARHGSLVDNCQLQSNNCDTLEPVVRWNPILNDCNCLCLVPAAEAGTCEANISWGACRRTVDNCNDGYYGEPYRVSLTDCDCACISTVRGTPANIGCEGGHAGVRTALGCIPVTGQGFTIWLVKFAVPAGGVIAFILILYASLQLVLSAGDPGKIQHAKTMLTAVISGLILIIGAIFILRLIGVQIFSLPGF